MVDYKGTYIAEAIELGYNYTITSILIAKYTSTSPIEGGQTNHALKAKTTLIKF